MATDKNDVPIFGEVPEKNELNNKQTPEIQNMPRIDNSKLNDSIEINKGNELLNKNVIANNFIKNLEAVKNDLNAGHKHTAFKNGNINGDVAVIDIIDEGELNFNWLNVKSKFS